MPVVCKIYRIYCLWKALPYRSAVKAGHVLELALLLLHKVAAGDLRRGRKVDKLSPLDGASATLVV